MLQSIQSHAYLDKRVLSVFLLGIASGFPWVLIGSALTIWLKDSGVQRAEIGYAGLIFVVYAINFFWAPLVDKLRLPWFGSNLSQKKTWISSCQVLIVSLCVLLSFLSPQQQLVGVILAALAIAFCSATQDIAIDAYRIESFGEKETAGISAAAGAATSGWWTGYAGIGFVPLYLSDQLWSWQSIYLLMAAVFAVIFAISFFLPNPLYRKITQSDNTTRNKYLSIAHSQTSLQKAALFALMASPLLLTIWALAGSPGVTENLRNQSFYTPALIILGLALACIAAANMVKKIQTNSHGEFTNATSADALTASILEAFSEPIYNFFSKNEVRIAAKILLFIFLFKIGEAFLGRMSIVFYKEIGYSNTDIAKYSKMLTWWVTVATALFAGYLNSKLGLIRGLFISAIFMASSNLMFSWIALTGPDISLFIAATVVDGMATAWSLVSFVAFISALCNHAFSASQYALLSSLGNLGRTTLASLSGFFVDALNGNWALFFVITALMVIPSLFLLYALSKSRQFQFSQASN